MKHTILTIILILVAVVAMQCTEKKIVQSTSVKHPVPVYYMTSETDTVYVIDTVYVECKSRHGHGRGGH